MAGKSMAIVAKGPMPGQNADQSTEQTADEGINQVLAGEGHAEAEGEVVKEFHGAVSISRD